VGGKTISFETGKIGRQANAAVVARTVDTMVYSTVCYERECTPVDFTPLRVDYFARYRYDDCPQPLHVWGHAQSDKLSCTVGSADPSGSLSACAVLPRALIACSWDVTARHEWEGGGFSLSLHADTLYGVCSAVGQTIGAFHRRDSRGDDTEILVARLIDRPLRPMIKDGWQHETQVLAWLLSYDKENSPEALAICAASAAMAISEVPMTSAVAGVTVGRVGGEFVLNPTVSQLRASALTLTIAGTKAGILMIEGTAEFLSEEDMLLALQLGHSAIGRVCDAIEALREVVGKAKKLDSLRALPDNLVDAMDSLFGPQVVDALSVRDKNARGEAVSGVEMEIAQRFVRDARPSPRHREGTASQDPGTPLVELQREEDLHLYAVEEEALRRQEGGSSTQRLGDVSDEDEASELAQLLLRTPSPVAAIGYGYDAIDVKVATKKLLARKLRSMIVASGGRSDGRDTKAVRPIRMEASVLPMAHGSALFTRGETQTLSTATLGSKAMEAKFETVDELGSKRFYLQYRFPPSSVGEVGRVGGVNRREVGHGNLAERALVHALPSAESFPYAIRAESLVTESSGSSRYIIPHRLWLICSM
jgi:polyribonucleotide nucleotidyltransferase